MITFVQKFPNRASELLQYMEIIRHAAKAHGRLGWCIYDHKFRHKAAASRTLSWANIDMQLWLRIFTASSTQLREDYSLFSNGPSNKAGAARDAICHSHNRSRPCPLLPNCPYTHRCNRIGCGENHPGYTCPQSRDEHDRTEYPRSKSDRGSKRQTKSRAVSLLSNTSIDNRSNLIPLDNNNIVTPIHVDALEDALRGHPDP